MMLALITKVAQQTGLKHCNLPPFIFQYYVNVVINKIVVLIPYNIREIHCK